MLPLYRDPHFIFRFNENRIIPRFHLEGVDAGRIVLIYQLNPMTEESGHLLMRARVGEAGWVELPESITVRAGEGFRVIGHPRVSGWGSQAVVSRDGSSPETKVA